MADFKYDRREPGTTKVIELRGMNAEARRKRIEEVKAKGWRLTVVSGDFAYFERE